MRNPLLSGRETAPSRWLLVAWSAIAGWLMGAVYLALMMSSQLHDREGRHLALAGVTAALCALAALVGTLPKRPLPTFGLTVLLSVLVSLACSPLTFLLLSFFERSTLGHWFLEGFFASAVLGALIAAPLGLAFGIYAGAVAAVRAWLARRPSLSTRELTFVVLGLGWLVLAAGALPLLAAERQAAPEHHTAADPLALVMALIGGVAVLLGLVRPTLRFVWTIAIRRGALPGWSVEAPCEAEPPALPRLFPFGADVTLVRRATHLDGPFRSGDAQIEVARVGARPAATTA